MSSYVCYVTLMIIELRFHPPYVIVIKIKQIISYNIFHEFFISEKKLILQKLLPVKHTTNTRDEYPCLCMDSSLQTKQPCGHRIAS